MSVVGILTFLLVADVGGLFYGVLEVGMIATFKNHIKP